MKKNTVLAKRYARALFLVGKEEDAVDAFGAVLTEVAGVFEAEAAVRDGLTNPLYPVEVREKVMDYLADQAQASPVMRNFLRLLVQKKRVAILPEIAAAYGRMVDEDRNVCRGRIVTAMEMDPELEAQVKATLEKITGKTVIVTTEVDPSILGGLVAQVGDVVLDGSLRTQLDELKESITGRE